MTRRTGALLGVLALLLGGCSVEVVDDDASPGSPSGGTRTTAGIEEGTARPAKPRPGADDGEGGTAPATDLPTRSGLLPLVTTQQSCAGGDLDLPVAGAAVEVTGTCGTLAVSGASVVAVAGDVTDLVVSGAGATVLVRSAASVTIDAAGVTVVWESGAPRVDDRAGTSTSGTVAP